MWRNARYLVPNTVTALNMLFGFVAISHAIRGDFYGAIWSVYLATFLDLLDGRLARTLNASSKFGIEMDSFSDLVTFGVAPSVLMYQAFFAHEGIAGLVVSFLPMLFSAMRLARFNVETSQTHKRYMKGVPTPMSAITLVGYVAFADTAFGNYDNRLLPGIVIISVCLLMVSSLKFDSNSISRVRNLGESWKLIPFALSVLTVAVYGTPMLFIWGAGYVTLGLSRWAVEHRPRRGEATA